MRWRARVATAAAVIGAGSLAWSVVATARGPAGAYFSTFTRAWEIALGALIGIATTSATRLPRLLARAASAAGVGLFVAACAVIGATTPFPGAAALLPTAATALLIVGGLTERGPLPNRALCLAPLRFLGRISYSVYLWHWPLIVFAAALYPTLSKTAQMRLLILLITLAVATLSFYLVEQPGRRIGAHARSACRHANGGAAGISPRRRPAHAFSWPRSSASCRRSIARARSSSRSQAATISAGDAVVAGRDERSAGSRRGIPPTSGRCVAGSA